MRATAEKPHWEPGVLLQSPLFEPLHAAIARLAWLMGEGTPAFPALEHYNALLRALQPPVLAGSGVPLRFVRQETGKQPFHGQYEPRCYLDGEVQTREHNWHDLLNALVWLTFPQAKAAINARHYSCMTAADAARGDATGTSQRGSRRDMLTLLDESGVVVACADAELDRLLRGFQWKELFWHRRERLSGSMGFFVFGHGLYEKALRPYIGMTGQGWVLPVEPAFFEWPLARRLAHLDGLLAARLAGDADALDPRALTPVPVLGVPGWARENAAHIFYDDSSYFRPGRLSSSRRL